MTQANVLPSDRVAAADLLDEISDLLDHNGIGQVADLIRDGEYDDHEATIAFARHRDASVRELVEALSAWRPEEMTPDTAPEWLRELSREEYSKRRNEENREAVRSLELRGDWLKVALPQLALAVPSMTKRCPVSGHP